MRKTITVIECDRCGETDQERFTVGEVEPTITIDFDRPGVGGRLASKRWLCTNCISAFHHWWGSVAH